MVSSLFAKLAPQRPPSFLVSFCNVRDYEKPVLALVTAHRGKKAAVRWIRMDGIPPLGGATGLCRWRDLVCVVHQRGLKIPPGFVIVDPRRGFRVVSRGRLPAGPHSVCVKGDDLYFVVSGRDSIYRARPQGEGWEVARHWTFPGSSGERDENHLNAVTLIDGRLCISGFGTKASEQWTSARRGFVYDVDAGRFVWEGIHHPHSLLAGPDTIWVCESAENVLLSRDGVRVEVPSTYLRGLARVNGDSYVGSSRRRLVSDSTGARTGGAPDGDYAGNCCVYRIVGDERKLELVVDLSEERHEIYDILPVQV